MRKPGGDLVADGEIVVAVGHHAKAFNCIDENDVVGDMRARLRRGGADDQRGGVDRPLAAGAFFDRVRRAAYAAKVMSLDLNPVLLDSAGRGCVVVDAVLFRG